MLCYPFPIARKPNIYAVLKRPAAKAIAASRIHCVVWRPDKYVFAEWRKAGFVGYQNPLLVKRMIV
jgi:hypothetical protein